MPETRTFEFDVFITPKSMNAGGAGSRTHWAAAHREKKAWEEAVMTELMVARAPRGAELVEARVVLNWKRSRRRDVTNYYGTVVKPLADALVKFGLLADDTDDLFRVRSFSAVLREDWPPVAGRLQGFASISLEVTYP